MRISHRIRCPFTIVKHSVTYSKILCEKTIDFKCENFNIKYLLMLGLDVRKVNLGKLPSSIQIRKPIFTKTGKFVI